MKMPRFLWRWIEERRRIPQWVRWFWPHIHWCKTFRYALVIGDGDQMPEFGCPYCARAEKN